MFFGSVEYSHYTHLSGNNKFLRSKQKRMKVKKFECHKNFYVRLLILSNEIKCVL